jgi:hypothetical protein
LFQILWLGLLNLLWLGLLNLLFHDLVYFLLLAMDLGFLKVRGQDRSLVQLQSFPVVLPDPDFVQLDSFLLHGLHLGLPSLLFHDLVYFLLLAMDLGFLKVRGQDRSLVQLQSFLVLC